MFGLRHANSPVHVMDFIVKTAVKIHSEALLQIFLELGFIFKLPVSRLIIHVDTFFLGIISLLIFTVTKMLKSSVFM